MYDGDASHNQSICARESSPNRTLRCNGDDVETTASIRFAHVLSGDEAVQDFMSTRRALNAEKDS